MRVYERADREGLFMTRAWVSAPSGRPVEKPLPAGLTRKQAETLAKLTAAERQREVILRRPDPLAPAPVVTLGDLLEAYHGSEVAGRWRPRTQEEKVAGRRLWLSLLPEDQDVMELSPSLVEEAAQKAARRDSLSSRTEGKWIAYLRAAIRWAYRRRRLIPRDPLDGIQKPEHRPDTTELIYSPEEIRQLVTPHEEVDWRVTLAASIAYDTGRRITAILRLQTDDLVLQNGRLELHFLAEHDKRGVGARVPVSADTALLVAQAVERTEVEDSGWLFPGGRLEYVDEIDGPANRTNMARALHRAEETLGIRHVPGRAYHGIKRRHVTTSMEISQGDTSLVGDVTGNVSADLLRRVYRQQNRARVTAQVDLVRRALEDGNAAESTPESTPSQEGG